MKKRFILFLLLAFAFYPVYNSAGQEYQEESTPLGNVVVGLSKEQALEKFGYPQAATGLLWHYTSPQKDFYVYFASADILSIHVFPESCEVPVNFPFEFKAFENLSDSSIRDITSEVQLSVKEPKDFILDKPGIIIPKKIGEYQIVAKYRNKLSNPIYLTVKVSQEKVKAREEQLLSINVLPYKPIIPLRSKLDFVALGTFFNRDNNTYYIREISNDVGWFTQQGGSVTSEKGRRMDFNSLGKFKVFCKSKDLESYPQEAEVKQVNLLTQETLKNITVLPELVVLGVGSAINFVAMATYDSNRVEDISAKAKWQITDRGVIDLQEKGRFLTKSQGIAEVTAELDNFQSLPAKVIVFQGQAMAAFGEPSDLNKTAEEKEKKEEKKEENKGSSDLSKEIKKEVEKIAKNAVAKGDKLILIKIIPDYLNIPLGEKSKLSAMGVYSNHSEEDLTLFTDWRSSDKTIAAVSAGEVSTFSMGKVKVFAKFRGLESAPASVTVEGPKLISIVIFPQNTRITIENKLSLKAEGHFSDSSVQDITSLVSWEVSNPRIIRIEKAIAYALDIGKTQVFAQYSGVRSLPANIRVIFTLSWLLKRIFAIILFLILTTTLVLFAFYLMTKMAKKRLLSLYKNPREFILNLYVNTKALLDIFGKRIKEILPPLSYARLVEERHSVKDNSFLRFTVKFEEAKYSKHILGSEDVDTALNDYNSLLMAIFSNQKRFSLLLRYCATLLHRRPLFIHIHK